MAATWKLIKQKVGEGGVTAAGPDVRTVQELLVAAGTTEPNVLGGSWGGHSKNALLAFQKENTLPERNYVEPNDECLFALAEAAEIVVPLPKTPGITGIKTLHQWFVDNDVGYQSGAEDGGGNRALYGLDFDGCTEYGIQRINRAWRAGPVLMDCTTYVNAMLGVFVHGHLHSPPYDADCSAYGNTANTHLARERYSLPLVYRPVTKDKVTKRENYFKLAADIAAATSKSNLYVIEVGGGAGGGVSHMALLYDGQVYECTTGQVGSACISRSLEDFVKAKPSKIFYVFGPRPA